MSTVPLRSLGFLAAAGLASLATALALSVPVASADPTYGHGEERPGLTATTILSGTSLRHTYTEAGTSRVRSEALTDPDDITQLGPDIFVGFQNGVGPQGQPSTSMNLDSTVVEMTTRGQPVAQWDIAGQGRRGHGRPRGRLRHRHGQRGRQLLLVHHHAGSRRWEGAALLVQRAVAPPRGNRRHLDPGRTDPDQRLGTRYDGNAGAGGTTTDVPRRLLGHPRRRRLRRHRHAALLRRGPGRGGERRPRVGTHREAGPDRSRLQRDRAAGGRRVSPATSC